MRCGISIVLVLTSLYLAFLDGMIALITLNSINSFFSFPVSTDVHDLDNDLIYYRPNGIPHSDPIIQPGSDSPGLPDISEVPENTEVDCSLPEPHSSPSTSTLSGGTDFIFISDEDSGSNEQSSDRYANIYCT